MTELNFPHHKIFFCKCRTKNRVLSETKDQELNKERECVANKKQKATSPADEYEVSLSTISETNRWRIQAHVHLINIAFIHKKKAIPSSFLRLCGMFLFSTNKSTSNQNKRTEEIDERWLRVAQVGDLGCLCMLCGMIQ